MTVFDFIVLSLAAWRLAHLVVKEEGPFLLFAKLRAKAGVEAIVIQGADGQISVGIATRTNFAAGLTCVWCVSVWTATLLTGLALVPVVGCYALWGARILAISALAIIVQELVARVRGGE